MAKLWELRAGGGRSWERLDGGGVAWGSGRGVDLHAEPALLVGVLLGLLEHHALVVYRGQVPGWRQSEGR